MVLTQYHTNNLALWVSIVKKIQFVPSSTATFSEHPRVSQSFYTSKGRFSLSLANICCPTGTSCSSGGWFSRCGNHRSCFLVLLGTWFPNFYGLTYGCATMIMVMYPSRMKPTWLRIPLNHVQPFCIYSCRSSLCTDVCEWVCMNVVVWVKCISSDIMSVFGWPSRLSFG